MRPCTARRVGSHFWVRRSTPLILTLKMDSRSSCIWYSTDETLGLVGGRMGMEGVGGDSFDSVVVEGRGVRDRFRRQTMVPTHLKIPALFTTPVT